MKYFLSFLFFINSLFASVDYSKLWCYNADNGSVTNGMMIVSTSYDGLYFGMQAGKVIHPSDYRVTVNVFGVYDRSINRTPYTQTQYSCKKLEDVSTFECSNGVAVYDPEKKLMECKSCESQGLVASSAGFGCYDPQYCDDMSSSCASSCSSAGGVSDFSCTDGVITNACVCVNDLSNIDLGTGGSVDNTNTSDTANNTNTSNTANNTNTSDTVDNTNTSNTANNTNTSDTVDNTNTSDTVDNTNTSNTANNTNTSDTANNTNTSDTVDNTNTSNTAGNGFLNISSGNVQTPDNFSGGTFERGNYTESECSNLCSSYGGLKSIDDMSCTCNNSISDNNNNIFDDTNIINAINQNKDVTQLLSNKLDYNDSSSLEYRNSFQSLITFKDDLLEDFSEVDTNFQNVKTLLEDGFSYDGINETSISSSCSQIQIWGSTASFNPCEVLGNYKSLGALITQFIFLLLSVRIGFISLRTFSEGL